MFFWKKKKSNVKNKGNKTIWYPMIVSNRQVVDTRKIAREIAARSGATEGEVIGILHDLGLVMREHLAEGSRIVLNGIGSFKISAQARGTGIEDEDKVSAMQFNHVKVMFIPESRTNRTLGTKEVTLISNDLKFAPVESVSSSLSSKGNSDKPSGSESGNSGGSTPETGGHAGI